jgi:hypothetical protein
MKSKPIKSKRKKSIRKPTRKKSTARKSTKKRSTGTESAETGIKAWLITWEGDEAKLAGKCKVAAVLPAVTNKSEVKFALRVLFFSGNSFSLNDKMIYGTGVGKEAAKWFAKPYGNTSQEYCYGHYPQEYLMAKLVKDLHCELSWQDHREHSLIWTEKVQPTFQSSETANGAQALPLEVQRRYTYSAIPK